MLKSKKAGLSLNQLLTKGVHLETGRVYKFSLQIDEGKGNFSFLKPLSHLSPSCMGNDYTFRGKA
jgi:hypothetical protein